MKAQTSISLSTGLTEHQIQIPGHYKDPFFSFSPKLEVFHYLEQPKIELGLSYTLFGGFIEYGANWSYPYHYSYRISRPINALTYIGVHSDKEQLVQTYGGFKLGYWSYKMNYYIENSFDWNDYSSGEDRLHHFAFGPRFGLSIGRKVQFIMETEHLWLTQNKYGRRHYLQRVSSIQFGIRYNIMKKVDDNNE